MGGIRLWPEILAAIGGIGALVAALLFLVRLLLTHWLARDLEYLKSEIAGVAKEYEVRFNTFQQRRADVLARLYGAISDAFVHGSVLASAIHSFGPDNQERRAETARKATNRALRLVSRYKIWLPAELPSRIQTLAVDLGETPLAFYFYRRGKRDEAAVRKAAARWKDKEPEIKEALDALEGEFRKIVEPNRRK